jgi:IclR family transcriptional regulator, KDG regulon repressor
MGTTHSLCLIIAACHLNATHAATATPAADHDPVLAGRCQCREHRVGFRTDSGDGGILNHDCMAWLCADLRIHVPNVTNGFTAMVGLCRCARQRTVAAMVAPLMSVTNAVRILKSFNSVDRDWGVTELARHLDLTKSSVHRLLSTMTQEEILSQDPETGKYHLGLALVDLAASIPAQQLLHEAVLAPMTELHNRSGETVHVAVLDKRKVVYVERLDSPATMTMFLKRGRCIHAHATATGKVLLAFLPRRTLDRVLDGWELEPVTEHTITNIDVLRAELSTIRERGYAENRHEAEVGIVSAAAPVRSRTGNVVAALGIAGHAEKIDPHRMQFVQVTMQTASLASQRLRSSR